MGLWLYAPGSECLYYIGTVEASRSAVPRLRSASNHDSWLAR